MSERSGRDDEVDLIIDAWSRRLPDVDLTPLDVMSRLRRVANRLARLRATAFSGAGLASWEFDVLAVLRREEPPHELSPAQLIGATMIGSAAMTNRLDNLHAQVVRVEVTRIEEGTFYAELTLSTPSGARVIDARPSDAIALAVRAEAPLFVADEVLDDAGIPAEIEDQGIDEPEVDEFKRFLDDVDPEDFQG